MPGLGFLGEVLEKGGVSVMGITDFLMMLGTAAPALVLWIAVIVFAIMMLKRGGGRAERFLVAGAGLKIIGNLLSTLSIVIIPWLVSAGYGVDYASPVVTGYGMFWKVVGMAGIVCLVYAFWVKFRLRSSGEAVTSPQH